MGSKLIFILLILVLGLPACAQTDSSSTSDFRNYRATEGSGEFVTIDTVTPLPQLINTLATDWKLVMTGKAYWIGYTDNMFSIANHGNDAIPLLTHFIDTVHSVKAKKGAILTLHLIGIHSTIVDRFLEEFKNKYARKALLKYVDDTSLHTTVLSLLKRDPWLTDIPHFMAYLELPGRDCSKVLSVLKRYEIKHPPLNQPISGSVFERPVRIKHDDYGIKPMHALVTFQKQVGKRFIVDSEITSSPEWTKSIQELSSGVGKTSIKSVSVFDYFRSDLFSSYCNFSELPDYFFDGNTVTVYGPSKARDIWLSWWAETPQDERERKFYK